jgi:DNA polymerase-3 subunit delta
LYYIYHGEDDFSRSEAVRALRAEMGDPQFADLNTTVLDGRGLGIGELRHHADAIPFLTDTRLVLVEGLLTRLEPRRKPEDTDESTEEEPNPDLKQALLDYLPNLPATTRLVFIEPKKLSANNAILRLADKQKKNAQVRHFPALAPDALPDWVLDRVQAKGGQIDYSAANDLTLSVGADLRALDGEVEKLLLYRGGEPIRREDVRALVAPTQEESIFELVDALGQRRTARALDLLHDQLGHGANEMYLLTMITRQFRLMLQVGDLTRRGISLDSVQKQLGLHPFVTRKIAEQARNYSVEQLKEIMGRLLEADLALKTSRLEPQLALDLLVIELTVKSDRTETIR